MSMNGRVIARNAGWLSVVARCRGRASGWGIVAAFIFMQATIARCSVKVLKAIQTQALKLYCG